MPRVSKGKCVFNSDLKEKYLFLETTKSESIVQCKKCKSEFSIASGGNADIVRHLKTDRHSSALKAASSSKPIQAFFTSKFNAELTAIEAVWAYHVVNANHSFKSSDCATKIIRTCFKVKSFACSQTKCQAIVVNVLAPRFKEMVQEDLNKCHYVTIYTDASNHGNVKLFPVLVRYFIPTTGVHVKVLDVKSLGGETGEMIEALLSNVADEYGLKKKIVAFCGDNAPTNFGGITRGGDKNVFSRMQKWLPHLIGIGCVAHIVHNALKEASESLPIDMEWIVVKTYSYFYRNTTHIEALKSICVGINIDFNELLGYAKTRFLALGPAVKRILQLFDALKEVFNGINNRKYAKLRDFYNDPSSNFWLRFGLEQVLIEILRNNFSFLIRKLTNIFIYCFRLG